MEYIIPIILCLLLAAVILLFVIRAVRLRRRRLRTIQRLRQLRMQEQERAAKEQQHMGFQQLHEQQNAEEEYQQIEAMQRGKAAETAEEMQETAVRTPNAAELARIHDCYVPVMTAQYHNPPVNAVSLTEQEAAAQGFSFRKKSRAVRITNYHGEAAQLTVPALIGGMPVNEIGTRAFAGNRTLRRVELPTSVRKLGTNVFHGASIEVCVLAAQIQTLPAGTFEQCRNLSEVQLPQTLFRIGENAFSECASLHRITFPAALQQIGDHAFRGSGLSDFTITPQTHLGNGAAFCHTPLHNNYQFILSALRNDRADILLCGSRVSGTLVFPANMHMLVHRAALEFSSAREFDFSKCASVIISSEAFLLHVVQDGFIPPKRPAKIILPAHTSPVHFPPRITAANPDGTPFAQDTVKIPQAQCEEASCTLHTAEHVLASYSIRGSMQDMTLVQEQGRLFHAEHHAFVTPELVSLNAPLSGSCAELFSVRCRKVQRVQFMENGEKITKYIPDRALIGTLHEELLPAFCGDGQYFFDRRVYDEVFKRGTFRWTDGSIRQLTQKQRLLMCFDVLRSTQRAHEGAPMLYVEYLCAHLRYARKLCKKIAPTHPDYLPWLAQQDPKVWFVMLRAARRSGTE